MSELDINQKKAFSILDPGDAETGSRMLQFVLPMKKQLLNCLLGKVSFWAIKIKAEREK